MSSLAMSSHSSTLFLLAQTFAPQSAKDLFPTQAMELQVSSSRQEDHCENISNVGYGATSFLIMAAGALQKPSV
jgi:hypothetical protein